MTDNKQHMAELFHMAKERIEDGQKKSLDLYFSKGEVLHALKNAGRDVWKSYDPSLKSWSSVCVSLGLKPSNADNCIALTKRFAPVVNKHGVAITQEKLRLLMSLSFTNPAMELDYIHSFSALPVKECRELIRQAKGKPQIENCAHSNIEQWTKCADCGKWEKLETKIT